MVRAQGGQPGRQRAARGLGSRWTSMSGRAGNGHVSPAQRYSALGLVRHGLTRGDWPRVWRAHELKRSYDVVVIGAGVHGLATAYYLAANHGVRRVAVVDKGYVGGGGSGRNTAIIRSNYLTPEGVRFYDRSVRALTRSLAADLNFNIMFAERGHLTLAHNDGSLRTMRWRAEVNKLEGINSEVIGPDEIKQLVPFMDTSSRHALSDPRRAATIRPAASCATTRSTGVTPAPATRWC